MGYRYARFEPSYAAYQAMVALLDRVHPRHPASADWHVRADRDRDPHGPFHREVVVTDDEPNRFVAVMEWARHWWSPDGSRFRLSIDVDPAHRCRGIGTRLFALALARAPRGRPVAAQCDAAEDDPGSVAFLLHRAFRQIQRVSQSELALASFDPAAFDVDLRRVEASGLELVTLAGRTSDEPFLRDLFDLQAATIIDAPGASAFRLPAFDEWRRSYHDNPDLFPDLHVMALDGPRPIGMTQLWASQATPEILYTGFTGVLRAHRQRGIATALKTRSLTAARALRGPTCRRPVVRTGNEETNPMLALNRKLGFVEQPAVLVFEREVGGA